MNVLDLYRSKGLDCKKVASTHGGEYCGACPGCGGEDRFRIWPEQDGGQGSFFCRGCDTAGDRVTFLMAFDGMSYPEACASLDIKLEDKKYRTPKVSGAGCQVSPEKSATHFTGQAGVRCQEKQEKKAELPPEVWVEKAGELVKWAHGKLMENAEQLDWLAARGIDRAAAERLGWNPGKDGRDLWRPREAWGLPTEMKENKFGKMVKKRLWIPRGIVIPEVGGQKSEVRRIRIRRPEENPPRYYVIPGSNMDMMWITGEKPAAVLVVESELDGIMCHCQSGGMCSVLALGSSAAKPDENLMEMLRNAAVILVALDFDGAGEKAMRWWKDEFHQAKLWPVPEGGDPGEAFQAGVDIRAWISAGLPPAWGVGGSLLDNKKQAAVMEPVIDKKKKVRRLEGEKIGGVEELAGLLKQHPVVIHNTAKRTFLAAPLKWQQQHWEMYQYISKLVFLTPEVLRFVCAHPAGTITGKNIILD